MKHEEEILAQVSENDRVNRLVAKIFISITTNNRQSNPLPLV